MISYKDLSIEDFKRSVGAYVPGLDSTSIEQLQTSPLSIYAKDCAGRIVWCNDLMVEMSGLSSLQDMVGKNDNEFLWSTIYDDIRQADTLVMEQKNVFTVSEGACLIKTRKFQGLCTVISHKFPLLDAKKRMVGVAGIGSLLIDKDTEVSQDLDKVKANIAYNINGITSHFTQREAQCINEISKGYATKVAAQNLSISPRTLEEHLNNARAKFNCARRLELISKLKTA